MYQKSKDLGILLSGKKNLKVFPYMGLCKTSYRGAGSFSDPGLQLEQLW